MRRGGQFRVSAPGGERPDWLLLYRRRNVVDDRFYRSLEATHQVRFEGVSLLRLVRYDPSWPWPLRVKRPD